MKLVYGPVDIQYVLSEFDEPNNYDIILEIMHAEPFAFNSPSYRRAR